MENMEQHFEEFRNNIIGINTDYDSPFGRKKIVYADWIASGRLYGPIEDKLKNEFGPFVANTHTETSETGTRMTHAYHYAHKFIKDHVNAGPDDVIITAGTGMTRVVTKFQRMLGLKVCGELAKGECIQKEEKPVVFISHMEHHSNHTSWFETYADVIQIAPNEDLLVDPGELRKQLEIYKDRKFKIGSFTACSNVTGIITPYHELAKVMHEYGGYCFIDFAASAPYVDIDMHPEDPKEKLDAIFFSPHKFLGGPGSAGVLVFDSSMYHCDVPDNPGGGTVDWTNPWGGYRYSDDIEVREDGGTPGFLQAIRSALSIQLKNKIGVENIRKREEQLVEAAFKRFDKMPRVNVLANNVQKRLGCISFYVEDIHYNLFVKLLSDRFGVQVRGGCACAGTYGHYLLGVSQRHSKKITDLIDMGNLSEKPGWVRLSIHPTMTDAELTYIMDSIEQIVDNAAQWQNDYEYSVKSNEYYHKDFNRCKEKILNEWFTL
ncbi:MAG: aminotransferase class V-fold PLP-dependent enzyme [bacterium]|nr:aminotransferase class V-fold PLP-dependent enzyme [bacterium]